MRLPWRKRVSLAEAPSIDLRFPIPKGEWVHVVWHTHDSNWSGHFDVRIDAAKEPIFTGAMYIDDVPVSQDWLAS